MSTLLPKDFRFPPGTEEPGTEEVEIRWEGERIVLEPVHVKDWPESFWRAFEGMPEDFERPPHPHHVPGEC